MRWNFLLLLLMGLPLTASATIHITAHNIAPSVAHVTTYVSVWARKVNAAHSTQNELYDIPEDASKSATLSASLFAPDPAGEYYLEVRCSNYLFHDMHKLNSELTQVIQNVMLPDNAHVDINVTCVLDEAGHLKIPKREISILSDKD